jgi:hypothetical protein
MMSPLQERIAQELAAAEAAWKDGNEGKARVCARRAVARATEAWSMHVPVRRWSGDAMDYLRHIQQDTSFPLPIRQAAERLSTKVTQRQSAPFTTDPIGDAKLIVAHFRASAPEEE